MAPPRRETLSLPERTNTMKIPKARTDDWLQPPAEQEGLKRYVETIRERLPLILATVAVTTLIAILYVISATKTYEAEADLLVTPLPGDDPVLNSLGVLTQSVDPIRDVETATRLVTNIDVAERVAEDLEIDDDPQDLLEKVEAEPLAQSNIVAVIATDETPESARRLANGFARAAVSDRTEQLHAAIDDRIPQLEAQLEATEDPDLAQSRTDQISTLELYRSGPDPTLRLETQASLPTTQASPRPVLSVAAGIFGGLILGIAAAFASQVLDPRLRREAQLRRLYRLPILARIPKETRTVERPLSPSRISPVTSEAYRTLRATLSSRRRSRRGRMILITGSAPSEGKTTTAVNLATSMALAGQRVILIESDLRRPVVGDTLQTRPERGGVVSVLIENSTLEESLVQTAAYGPNLRLLLADYEGGWIAELFSIPTAEKMIDEARGLADWVIVDSPPLNEVVDALPLTRLADDVLIVVRLGTTRLDKLSQLGELLVENDVRPTGFAVVGTPRPSRGEYHYYAGVSSETSEAEGASRQPARRGG